MAGNEFGVFVDVDVVFVAIVVLSPLLCPACIKVFVRQFVGLLGALTPFDRDSTGLDQGLVRPTIALDGHWHKGGINDLAAFELNAHLAQRLVRVIKQCVSQLVFFEGFTKGPYGACRGNVVC
jgi:hypothetical protein